ncbi:hypothetical protein CEXT_395561 [Caerostris extrusa]|uniref:Uncharacterized protein n=1 Tax=Caerostris extrusa TaxID=172846 RepID=A0AAV4Y7S3_CAEEX|nr:hypothetical protein CEXT_395561 [Caerostris extrusa]
MSLVFQPHLSPFFNVSYTTRKRKLHMHYVSQTKKWGRGDSRWNPHWGVTGRQMFLKKMFSILWFMFRKQEVYMRYGRQPKLSDLPLLAVPQETVGIDFKRVCFEKWCKL